MLQNISLIIFTLLEERVNSLYDLIIYKVLQTDLKKIAFSGGRIHFRFVGHFIVIHTVFSAFFLSLNTSLKQNLTMSEMKKD